MKCLSHARKYGAAVVASTVGLVGTSMAAVDAAVTTKLTETGTDAATLGAAVLVVIIGIVGFKMLRKAV